MWKTRQKPATTISTPLFQDDRHFYGIEQDGSLCCFDAATGDQVWSTLEATSKRMGTAHLTPHGDRVFLLGSHCRGRVNQANEQATDKSETPHGSILGFIAPPAEDERQVSPSADGGFWFRMS